MRKQTTFITSVVVATASAALVGAFFPAAARSQSNSAKNDAFIVRKLAAQTKTGWSEVIVRFDGTLTSEREQSIRQLGGYVYRRLPVIESAAVRVPNRNLAKLTALDWVQRVSSDAPIKKNDETTFERSGASVAFGSYGLTGKGVTVAVVDSGVDGGHPDLRGVSSNNALSKRVLANVNFVPGTTKTDDLCGHGTHVGGIIAGNGAASTGSDYFRTFYGVARQANLVNVRVLDTYGNGSVSSVIKGIDWVIANKATYKIRVINLSLGHPVGESYTTDPLCQAVEKAYRAGIVVVCAAGNNGRLNDSQAAGASNEGFETAYGSIQSPANSPYVITVGAMKASASGRANDRIATYSSRGPTRIDLIAKPDIVAPGNRVISLTKNSSYLDNSFSGTNTIPLAEYAYTSASKASCTYFRLSGTSMAAPVVSGAAALMLEKDPSLSPDTVKARLMISADKWAQPDGTMDVNTFGAGYLNIPAALNTSVVAKGPALSPPLVRDDAGDVLLDASRIIWGGTQEIWGIDGVTGTRVIWGGAVVEDAGSLLSPLTSSRVIWGEDVWADRVIWGEANGEADLSATAIYGEN